MTNKKTLDGNFNNIYKIELELKSLEQELLEKVEIVERQYEERSRLNEAILQITKQKQQFSRATIIELLEVQTALRKIQTGNYGYCEACGAQIEPNHLLVNPCARFCLACYPKS